MKKEDWEIKKLGEVGTIITGNTPKTSIAENYSSADICFVKPSDIQNDKITLLNSSENYISEFAKKQARVLPVGSVLVTCIGIIGKTAVLQKEAATNQQINSIIPSENINSKFLAYALFDARDRLNHISNAPVVPIINKTQFSDLKLPIPPLPIQEQIVAELDTLSDIIAKKRQQLAELNTLAQATFYDMFGDPVENEKGWKVKYWEDIFMTRTGKLNANAMNENGIYPFFTCSKQAFSINEYAFDCEALILAGNNATANYDVKHYKGKFNAYQRTYILNLLNEYNSYLYFKFLLESKLEVMQQQSLGINTKYLTLSILKALSFILPPLDLQNQFAEQIEAIEKQKELINQSITEVQKLFDYTMDKYFN